jgi:hypothetical protein
MIKSFVMAFGLVFLVNVAFGQAKIQFDKTTHDFGDLKEGLQATYKFKFKNVGKDPLVISEAQPSCGCTVPSYPKEPIAAGESGEIEVIYNTVDRPGIFTKTINIVSNSDGQPSIQLMIKGNVIGKSK